MLLVKRKLGGPKKMVPNPKEHWKFYEPLPMFQEFLVAQG
jgi:hypothetical protein